MPGRQDQYRQDAALRTQGSDEPFPPDDYVNVERLMTEADLADRLGMSKEWVQKAARKGPARKGGIPSVRPGRFYRFIWPDVVAHLRDDA